MQGYSFLELKADGDLAQAYCSESMSPKTMTARQRRHAELACLGDDGFTMHSLRTGAAAARAMAGEDVPAIMAAVG